MRRRNTLDTRSHHRSAFYCAAAVVIAGADGLQAANDGAQSAPVATLPAAAVRLTPLREGNAVGDVAVEVVAPGSKESNLFLLCSVPVTAAEFSITRGGSRNIGGPASLGPNDPPIRVRCTPQSEVIGTALSCEQRVSVGEQPPPLSVTVVCPASEALIEVTPELDFGTVPVGQESYRWVVIANRAARPATILGCRFEGDDAVDFEIKDFVDFHPNPNFAPRFPLTIPGGIATQLPISFHSKAPVGPKAARLVCRGATGTTVGGNTALHATTTVSDRVPVNAIGLGGLVWLVCGVLAIAFGFRRFA